MKRLIVIGLVSVLWATTATAAPTPAQKCQQAKNKAAGKYASCRQSAEAKLATTGDTSKYNDAIDKCETKYQTSWQKAEAKAAAAGGSCTTTGDESDVKSATDEHTDNVAQHLAGAPLADCPADLATCNTDLTTCNGSLTSCNSSLTTCNAGTAAVGDVLSGKTFSSSAGLGVSGTMANNGAVNITPGTAAQAIAAGYHNGSGSVAGDADLASGNIRSGVNIFGVNGDPNVVDSATGDAVAGELASGKKAWVDGVEITGTGIIATGNAVAADVLTTKTFSNASAAGVSGTMANNGAVNIMPGTSAQTIAAGYHNGSGSVAGDADLVAANIANGVNIFGVTGTALPSQPLRTGQTQCDQGAGTLGACPGSPSGQDGTTLKGQTRSYTVNANATITDNKTGLIWEKLDDNNANGIHDYSATFTWYNAFKKIQVLNGNVAGCIAANNPDACCTGAGTGSCTAFAGQTDWRLPNVNELQSLADYGRFNPSIDPSFNTSCAAACTTASCSCTQSNFYWSATTFQGNPSGAWLVYFYYGGVFNGSKTDFNYVRGVRGGS